MGLISKIRARRRDMGTITTLLRGAERHAVGRGEELLGAHHLLLSALDLPDDSAARAFARVGANPAAFASALEDQHPDALRRIGVGAPEADAETGRRPGTFMSGDATLEAALQETYALHAPSDAELSGAHVVAGVASVQLGTASRALAAMGVSLEGLKRAALAEVEGAPWSPDDPEHPTD